jgi:hypothetical protein
MPTAFLPYYYRRRAGKTDNAIFFTGQQRLLEQQAGFRYYRQTQESWSFIVTKGAVTIIN